MLQIIQPETPSADESALVLGALDRQKTQLQQNFHLYQEIQALPASDRDALFKILWDAQSGDSKALEAIYSIVYDEIPVDMEEFVLGKRYLALKGLINQEKLDLLMDFDQPHVRILNVAAGSGGGKSFMVSIILSRLIYKLLCLKRPELFYMLGPGSKIACINLSISKEQARDVIFAEFCARLDAAPWFQGKVERGTMRAQFPKGVAAFSGGRASTSYYGYNTYGGAIDEVCFMMEGEKDIAEELVEALTKSMSTRFPRAWKLMLISTLRSPDDYLSQRIQYLREEGVQLL